MSKQVLNPDEVEFKQKLIESVRKRDFLYNMKSADYKNVERKNETWDAISKEIELNGYYDAHGKEVFSLLPDASKPFESKSSEISKFQYEPASNRPVPNGQQEMRRISTAMLIFIFDAFDTSLFSFFSIR